MHPSPLLPSLLLLLQLSDASLPPLHHSPSPKTRRNSTAAPPNEYIEITRPLLLDSHTPSCTLPVLSHTFANRSATNTTYSPPPNCDWSNAVLHFSASATGSQHDGVAAVWLSGAELFRTTTPAPSPEGTSWNFRKDVTRYASLLRRSNLTLVVMLENEFAAGIHQFNLTFFYYDISSPNPAANFKSSQIPPNFKSKIERSLELNDNPADLILPLSKSTGAEGFWCKIESARDGIYQGIQIPSNTYRALIEIYVSFHGNDEFWYFNPPNYYIQLNNLTTQRGHGAYREVIVKLDDNLVGSVIPFPVISSQGINPLFWQPVVSIGAFNLPSYELELTPILSMLLDDKLHYFELKIADAISYWLIDANLHLWLDHNSPRVQAGPIRYIDPSTCVERESKFHQLNGKFELEGERKSEAIGWVQSSAGNFTTHVWSRVEFENSIRYKKSGRYKVVKQEVKVKSKVQVKSQLGYLISNMTVERRYPLSLKMTNVTGPGKTTLELDHSLKEEKEVDRFESELENRQRCSGWVEVRDGNVLSGGATMFQSYFVEDSYGCYRRRVWVDGGSLHNDTETSLCAAAAS